MNPEHKVLEADFDERFLSDYLGSVKNNPSVAVIEVIANSWDAGAEHVVIQWPEMDDIDGTIVIEDDGCGMTAEEFEGIWPTASYDRSKTQGPEIVLSDGYRRRVYGRNGVGRFGMFCFSDSYSVETWKDGKTNLYEVKTGKPYTIELIGSELRNGHGTRVQCVRKGLSAFIDADGLAELIQAKFNNGHLFSVEINDKDVDLAKEDPLWGPKTVDTPNGPVTLTRYSGRDGKGVVLRVDGRPVGEPSWRLLDEWVDSRRKTFNFQLVADVDFMRPLVLKDWTWFEKSDVCDDKIDCVVSILRKSLADVFEADQLERKNGAVSANLPKLRNLTSSSKRKLGTIMDDILKTCPKMKETDFLNVVSVIANCENSESGYELMDKLASVNPSDIDTLNSILSDWSIRELKVVHDELNRRIDVVKKLRGLVNNSKTNELHMLHPIFRDNLWIFGPEYDSCAFQSNRTITGILRESLGVESSEFDPRRPDIVMFQDSSLCAYCADKFNVENEAEGYYKIVIVELKRGGFEIKSKEKHQASDYATEILNSGKVNSDVIIMCYVLGSRVDPKISGDGTEGNGRIIIRPLAYDMLLRKAELRLFDLIRKMEDANPEVVFAGDPAIEEALSRIPDITSFGSDGKDD